MKTIKIIDLLNKIANGEEVPEKIKYKNIIWYFNKKDKTYYMNNTEVGLFYIEKLTNKLSDEVEIIEDTSISKLYVNNELQYDLTPKEDKKIDRVENLNSDCYYEHNSSGGISNEEIILDIITLKNHINQIIDYLKSKGE